MFLFITSLRRRHIDKLLRHRRKRTFSVGAQTTQHDNKMKFLRKSEKAWESLKKPEKAHPIRKFPNNLKHICWRNEILIYRLVKSLRRRRSIAGQREIMVLPRSKSTWHSTGKLEEPRCVSRGRSNNQKSCWFMAAWILRCTCRKYFTVVMFVIRWFKHRSRKYFVAPVTGRPRAMPGFRHEPSGFLIWISEKGRVIRSSELEKLAPWSGSRTIVGEKKNQTGGRAKEIGNFGRFKRNKIIVEKL